MQRLLAETDFPPYTLHSRLPSMTMCTKLNRQIPLLVAGESPLGSGAASGVDAALDSASQAASSIADASRDTSAAVQDAAVSPPDSSTSALSGLCCAVSRLSERPLVSLVEPLTPRLGPPWLNLQACCWHA